ncbi:hypothetical protein SteCoe_2551 [Stentor coeruleus]|uniref:Uncharacterized protein n=1 Tax=Stentor coeruleus TaxID=5963 RepID=A0A1R2CIW1_9CILI|nr:hypothetical protein SteCoe_9092 [Stentor coeruleus]OMJ94347.1 hypothetical protein SteCoe_2551 [Stentor coeruleus]
MWRPFTSDFVAHTYEEFRKKYDKVWAEKPIQIREQNEKFDPKNIFPYKLDIEELEKRKKEYKFLRSKVLEQRKYIKDRDASFLNTKKFKIQLQKEEDMIGKNQRKKNIIRIRSFASNKLYRHKSSNSHGEYENTFALTSLYKTTLILKNKSVESRNNASIPSARTKF